MAKLRKQAEPPPPSLWMRSKNGLAFKLKKTKHFNDADEWLYRTDFGDIVGNTLWSISDLERSEATFIDKQPADWVLGEWRLPKEIPDPWA